MSSKERFLTTLLPALGSENSLVTNTGGAGVHAGYSVFYIIGASLVYGSVSAGREKWPFNVLFFLKVEPPCDQT